MSTREHKNVSFSILLYNMSPMNNNKWFGCDLQSKVKKGAGTLPIPSTTGITNTTTTQTGYSFSSPSSSCLLVIHVEYLERRFAESVGSDMSGFYIYTSQSSDGYPNL